MRVRVYYILRFHLPATEKASDFPARLIIEACAVVDVAHLTGVG